MKKILLLALISLLQTFNSHAFGPDRTLNPDSSYSIRGHSFLSTSFNGWIFSCFNYKQDVFTGYAVIVSKDNGITWDSLLDYNVPPGSAFYPNVTDMIVAGLDSANLHVIISTTAMGAAGPEAVGSVNVYNAITGTHVGNGIYFGDAFTYNVSDIALCSDYKHPLPGANPYDVAVAVTENSTVDSVRFYYSDDGGLNFTGPYYVAADSNDFGSVDIAYGSYNNPAVGRFTIVWEANGHIGAAQSDVAMPPYFSGYNYPDSWYPEVNGLCYSPVISIQSADYQNNSGSYTTFVLFERYDSTNSNYDIMSFPSDDTQNGGFNAPLPVDTTPDNTISPAITFDESTGNFLATWYNSTQLMLPCLKHDIQYNDPWILVTNNYADTSSFDMPYPAIEANATNDQICLSWIQESDTSNLFSSTGLLKFDSDALPVYISNNKTNSCLRLFPNPTNGFFELHTGNDESILKVECIDVQGRKIFFNKPNSLDEKYFIDTAPGIYFVKISTTSGFFVQRLFKY